MVVTLPSRQITSINLAHTFAHLLLGVNDRIKNVSHVFVETLVAQGLTSRSYSCGLAALADCAGAASCFLQAIEPTHRFSLVRLFDFQVARWLPEIRGRAKLLFAAKVVGSAPSRRETRSSSLEGVAAGSGSL
jgi:hypothetical protein